MDLPMHQGYDAANISPTRTYLYFPTNSRAELSSCTRRTLQQKNRALDANFFFFRRIRSKIGRAVVGTGIFPTPITTDAAWNILAKDYIEGWGSTPELYSIDASRDLWDDQRLCAEELGAGDGEFFTNLVDAGGRLATQALDPFELETPFGRPDLKGYDDGILCDQYGRPLSYSVSELASPTDYSRGRAWKPVPAGQMVHVFRRRRAKQVRGIPPLYSSMNDGHDAMDLLAFEKATAKLHAVLAVTKTSKPGSKGSGLGGQIDRILNADGTTNRLADKLPQGAATVDLNEGESLDLKTSNRPSMAVIDGVKAFCHFMAMAADWPVSVLLSFAGVGGTAVRADLEDAQNSADLLADCIAWRHSFPIVRAKLAEAQANGDLPQCKDPLWFSPQKMKWQGPRKLTVDYGRSASATLALIKGGALTLPNHYEENGKNAEVEMKSQVDFLALAQAYCAEKGVEFSRYIEGTPGAAQDPKNEDEKPSKSDKETDEDE